MAASTSAAAQARQSYSWESLQWFATMAVAAPSCPGAPELPRIVIVAREDQCMTEQSTSRPPAPQRTTSWQVLSQAPLDAMIDGVEAGQVEHTDDGTSGASWAAEQWSPELQHEALQRLHSQEARLSSTAYSKQALAAKARQNWDVFYKHNTINFYKDRHYLLREYPELHAAHTTRTTLFEFGCAVGNAIFPLLRTLPQLVVYASDLSPKAIQLLLEKAAGADAGTSARVRGYVMDATQDALPAEVFALEPRGTDLALMLFVLSAIPPADIPVAMARAFELLFRDYGRYDEAQLRFKGDHKLQENFYVRADGTFAYYFRKEELVALAALVGFEVLEVRYIFRRLENRRRQVAIHRVWVGARFRKPAV